MHDVLTIFMIGEDIGHINVYEMVYTIASKGFDR